MRLKRDRFYRDWYKPRRRPDRATTAILILMGAFVVTAGVMTQCIHEPTREKIEPKNVHYQMFDDEKIIRMTGDSVRISDYWEF